MYVENYIYIMVLYGINNIHREVVMEKAKVYFTDMRAYPGRKSITKT